MTLEEVMVKWLANNGMFEDDAKKVLASVKAEADDTGTKGVLVDPLQGGGPLIAGYPPQLIASLTMLVKTHALQWVDENCPKAWYRPLLAGEV